MLKKLLSTLLFVAILPLSANATGIILLNLSDTSDAGADFQFNDATSEFSTIDTTPANFVGDQLTDVQYEEDLAFLTDILSNASFTLSGVLANGAPTVVGTTVIQSTTAGTFGLYDDANQLLLSGAFSNGSLIGSLSSTTGSFFDTDTINFTGGSLLSFISPNNGGLSIALSNILSGGNPGLSLSTTSLASFLSNGIVTITTQTPTAVPEPMSMTLLISGLAGMGLARKKRS